MRNNEDIIQRWEDIRNADIMPNWSDICNNAIIPKLGAARLRKLYRKITIKEGDL